MEGQNVNTMQMAQRAYSAPVQNQTRSPRGTEYAAFARITAQLKAAHQSTDAARAFPMLASALHQNLKLWRILAIDVADTNNALPAPLRAQVFSLYEFTDKHTRDILAGHTDAEALIEVNTAIMRGLSQTESVS